MRPPKGRRVEWIGGPRDGETFVWDSRHSHVEVFLDEPIESASPGVTAELPPTRIVPLFRRAGGWFAVWNEGRDV